MFVPSKSRKTKPQVSNTQTSVPSNLKTFQPLPSHEQISQRAYAIYQEGGSGNGQDQRDWFRAEKEMLAARKQQ